MMLKLNNFFKNRVGMMIAITLKARSENAMPCKDVFWNI
jgi:hypothetical protein